MIKYFLRSITGEIGVYGFIFAFYVGMGPIYWFPTVPEYFISFIKSCAYLFIVIYPILRMVHSSKFYFPGGETVFILMLAFFVFSIPGMIIGNSNDSLYRLQNTLQIIFFVQACGYLINQKLIVHVVKLAIYLFCLFCTFSLLFMIFNPKYISPLNSGLSIFETGFGGSRTSWSPAISLYIPWLYSSNMFILFFSVVFSLIMTTNQVFVAGRTGIIATLIPFFSWGIISKKGKIFLFTTFILSIYIFYALNNREKFRIIKGGFMSRADLDDFSTGRWEQYVAAIGAIGESPFLGQGFGEILYEGKRWLIHNAILKAAAESGIFYATAILCIFLIAMHRGLKCIGINNKIYFSAFLTICAGVISSMFEPGFMFGSFNNSCFWWVCFSICVSRNSTT